jgi:hypothetical protein
VTRPGGFLRAQPFPTYEEDTLKEGDNVMVRDVLGVHHASGCPVWDGEPCACAATEPVAPTSDQA